MHCIHYLQYKYNFSNLYYESHFITNGYSVCKDVRKASKYPKICPFVIIVCKPFVQKLIKPKGSLYIG